MSTPHTTQNTQALSREAIAVVDVSGQLNDVLSLPDHLRVFEAIAERDAEKAQLAMSELIELARMDTPISRRQKSRRAG